MIKGHYDYECDLCGAVEHKPFNVGPALEKPCLPLNWILIAERLICDKHDLHRLTIAKAVGLLGPKRGAYEDAIATTAEEEWSRWT